MSGITAFVISYLGEAYVVPPVIRYKKYIFFAMFILFYFLLCSIHEQSTATVPIVFILSAGSDPQSEIQKLAEELGFGGSKCKFLSLGQGQGPVALALLETAMNRGHWLMLQVGVT